MLFVSCARRSTYEDKTMTRKLEGKIAALPAATAGVGLATAKRFVAEGASVFIPGRGQSELDKAVAQLGPSAAAIKGNAADLKDLDRIYSTVKVKAGHIDVLFVNAGFYEFGKFGDITEEHFDKTFGTNVRGALFTVQKALPRLAKGASVILVGSIAAHIGIPAFSVSPAPQS